MSAYQLEEVINKIKENNNGVDYYVDDKNSLEYNQVKLKLFEAVMWLEKIHEKQQNIEDSRY